MSLIRDRTMRILKKTVTSDLTTNYETEANTSNVENIINVREQKVEVQVNNMQLADLDNEDTQRRNLNSKHLSLLLLNILMILFYCVQSILVKYNSYCDTKPE